MGDKELLLALLALLERQQTVSIPQVASLLGTSEEKIWNLLDTLVFCYDAASMRLDLAGNHATLVTEGPSQVLRLTAQETAILLDGLESQGLDADDALWCKLVRTKGCFSQNGKSSETNLRTITPPANPKLDEQIAAACEDLNHHMVAIEYQKEGAESVERREVEPKALTSNSGLRYLMAYDSARNGWRSFRLDRIKSLEVLATCFTPHDGAPASTAEYTARVRFDANSFPEGWLGLVKKNTDAHGRIEAEIPWYGSMWLPKKIVACMGAATPLEPVQLVDACRAYARMLLDGYASAE